MRALRILQEGLARPLEFMHAKRCTALWRAVTGLLNGQHLWLTALGRSLPGACADKHRIKAIDRLVGSAAVQQGVSAVYAALAAFLLRGVRRPVILALARVNRLGGVRIDGRSSEGGPARPVVAHRPHAPGRLVLARRPRHHARLVLARSPRFGAALRGLFLFDVLSPEVLLGR